MKAVKRALCVACTYETYTSDGTADKNGLSRKLRCPRDGSALKLSTIWYARGMIDGVAIRQPCGSRKSDADDYIAACRLAKRSGSILPGKEADISWADAIKNCNGWWDNEVEQGRMRTGSREHYTTQVNILNRYFEGMSLLTITKTLVNQMMDDMALSYAPASIAHAVKALKRIYNMHTENLDLEETPRPKLVEKTFIIGKVKLPEIDNEVEVSCTDVDTRGILLAIEAGKGKRVDKQRLRLVIMMGLGMLLRPCNINSLEWSELDLAEDSIPSVRISREKMKGKRDAVHPIPQQIVEELKAWQKTCDELAIKSKYVFPSPRDHSKPVQYMGRAITNWIKKLGMNAEGVSRKEKITPYVLTRHTGATELYEESGENLEMVSKTADHSDSRITRKRYVKNRLGFANRTVIPIQEAVIRRMVG